MVGLCLLQAAACADPAGNGSSPDLGPTPDRAVDRASPDAAPQFTPADLTLRQLSCLAAGLPTGTSSGSVARRTADLARLKEAGFSLMRTGFSWTTIEPTKGTFVFSGYDRRVQAAASAGVGHIALLGYGNPWATTKTDKDQFYPPDDPADFGRYVKAVVGHYKGKIKVYEIWNEPNAGFRFWKTHPKGDPKAFGALLKAAYTAAHAADPQAVVLFGGPFYHDQVIDGHLAFMAQVFKHHPDLGQYFDGMALHPYAQYPPAVAPEQQDAWEQPVDLMLRQVRSLMAKHSVGHKPIYTTEVGWPVWKQVSEQQQARYLVRSFMLLAAAGSSAYCWYTLRDFKDHGVPTEATFGLLAYAADPAAARVKPSWTAYSTLLQTVGAYKLTHDLRQQLALPAGTHAYRLRQGSRRATVIWARKQAAALDLPLAAGTTAVTQVSMLGQQSQLTVSAGKVRVSPGPDPVYLLEQ